MALHCVAQQDEWQFQTCQARSNRLEDDARTVTAAILAMRGVNQKKQKLIHQDGNLTLHRRPNAYKGLSRAWLRNYESVKDVEDWTRNPKTIDEPDVAKIPLN